MENKTGAFIVGYSIQDNEMTITIGKQDDKGVVQLTNVLQGEEALTLYHIIAVDNNHE